MWGEGRQKENTQIYSYEEGNLWFGLNPWTDWRKDGEGERENQEQCVQGPPFTEKLVVLSMAQLFSARTCTQYLKKQHTHTPPKYTTQTLY